MRHISKRNNHNKFSMYLQSNISANLKVYRGRHYPYIKRSRAKHRYEVTLGVGGNIGDMKRRLEHLFFFLKREPALTLMQTSIILKNPPFGYREQSDFYNTIIIVKTSMQAMVFLEYLMRVEKKFARKRSFANAPRTLDLDIIFFDNRVIKSKKLTIPHASWQERPSVLIPLAGITR